MVAKENKQKKTRKKTKKRKRKKRKGNVKFISVLMLYCNYSIIHTSPKEFLCLNFTDLTYFGIYFNVFSIIDFTKIYNHFIISLKNCIQKFYFLSCFSTVIVHEVFPPKIGAS